MAFVKKLLNSNKCVWAIFGNDEDSNIPEKYKSTSKEWVREFYWFFLRNSLHNFTFRIIGIADKSFTSVGKEPTKVFIDGWNWAIRKYKWIRLPFVSYKGAVKFYFGWRERGNFGIKLTNNPTKV